MRRSPVKKFIPFVLSLILSLTVFMIPWGICFYPKEQAEKVESNVIIPKEKEILVLIESDDKPLVFLHLRLNYKNLKITPLMPSLMAEDDGESLALGEIVKNGGLKYCQNSLNKSFGFNISRYITLNKSELLKLLKPFGSCDFTLENSVAKDGHTLFKKGRCLLNGENAILILCEESSLNDEERANLFADIVCSLFNEKGELSYYEKENFFNICANGQDNNLSVTDFISLKNYRIFEDDFIFSAK